MFDMISSCACNNSTFLAMKCSNLCGTLIQKHLNPMFTAGRTAQHSTAQHTTAQHSTVEHSTAQYSTVQHSTAQHSRAQHTSSGPFLAFQCQGTTCPNIGFLSTLNVSNKIDNNHINFMLTSYVKGHIRASVAPSASFKLAQNVHASDDSAVPDYVLFLL
jgi:hypothetical protein